jgi:hypothetical protein
LSIDLSYTGCTIDLRVVRISIKGETVLGLIDAKEARDTTETVDRETAIVVVNF